MTCLRLSVWVSLCLWILSSCQSSGAKQPNAGGFVFSEDFQNTLLEQCIMAEDGSVIELPEGKFLFNKPLSIDGKKNILVRGKGPGKTQLSFLHQSEGAEGFLVSNCTGIRMEGFTVQDAKGNDIKLINCDTVVLRDMNATWTSGIDSTNGDYAYYPVQCKNVLMERCEASYSSDAGIYIGQSINVIIRDCFAHHNVAGIEIENCINSEVYRNRAENNSGGILVFDTPELPLHNGRNARVYDNDCLNNNERNFGKVSSLVSAIPPGTGIIVLATDSADIFQNRIKFNKTVGIVIAGFELTGKPYTDSLYGPYSTAINIRDNSFESKTISIPDMTKDLGKLVALGLKGYKDIIVDGSSDPSYRLPNGSVPADRAICIRNNGPVSFANINLWKVKSDKDITDHVDHDLKKFDCNHPAIKGHPNP